MVTDMKRTSGMHKLDVWVAAWSLGGTFAALSALCGLAYMAFPDATFSFFRLIFHSTIPLLPVGISAASLAMGVVAAFIAGAVAGIVFAVIYNACLWHCKYTKSL